MSPRRRLRIWEAHKGRCCICHQQIDGVREKWIVEHVRALELGGSDEDNNLAPAHAACASEKTKDDHARTAKAKRAKQRHLGIRQSKSPMPCGKGSPFKKLMDGRVVRRDGK
jgi:hypothetical protein